MPILEEEFSTVIPGAMLLLEQNSVVKPLNRYCFMTRSVSGLFHLISRISLCVNFFTSKLISSSVLMMALQMFPL